MRCNGLYVRENLGVHGAVPGEVCVFVCCVVFGLGAGRVRFEEVEDFGVGEDGGLGVEDSHLVTACEGWDGAISEVWQLYKEVWGIFFVELRGLITSQQSLIYYSPCGSKVCMLPVWDLLSYQMEKLSFGYIHEG